MRFLPIVLLCSVFAIAQAARPAEEPSQKASDAPSA